MDSKASKLINLENFMRDNLKIKAPLMKFLSVQKNFIEDFAKPSNMNDQKNVMDAVEQDQKMEKWKFVLIVMGEE